MCGIAGIIGLKTNPEIAEKLFVTMLKRGPDAKGRYLNDEAMLLHTRLSIIDLVGGKQPMELKWGDEHYIITYNGELYNTDELRQTLRGLGHDFLTKSDTEVLIHSYAQWGEECLERLNGIYAFAVWHEKEKRLFMARDRMGVKPLFYKLHDGGLIFSSEIKTILAYPTVNAQLDAFGIGQILLLGPGRVPGSGVFYEIAELEPGCSAVYDKGRVQIRRYWSLKDREHTESFEETAEHVRFLVLDAVKRQMVSDVPIGTFLSGGLDSSLISAICADSLQEKGEMLDTFSVDYENNQQHFVATKYQPSSDGAYIDIMQQSLHSNHHTSVLKINDLAENLKAATMARDLPGMADVDSSLLLFCRDIRKNVKVALSGECADEIFGGYPWYRDPEVRMKEGFPWSQNIQYRSSFLLDEHVNKLKPQAFVHDLYTQTLQETDVLPGIKPLEVRMKQMVNLNQRWFMQTLLDRKDRMSMYCGLEVRVPFCDHRIAQYLYGVPWEYKDYGGNEKGLLRYAMRGVLPDRVLYRKKSPYPKTLDPQYMTLVMQMLNDLLQKKDAPLFSIVKKEMLQSLAEQTSPWPWYGQLMGTAQTIAFMLQINLWLDLYRIDII